MVAPGEFIEVYCHCPVEVCESRDVKGLYQRARAGRSKSSGISSPYEPPLAPEVQVNTATQPLHMGVAQVLDFTWVPMACCPRTPDSPACPRDPPMPHSAQHPQPPQNSTTAATPHAATIAIVGGGYSGALTAVHLLRHHQALRPLKVLLIEPRLHAARGLAYSIWDDSMLLNVPAGNMSALADDPAHFLHYCRALDPSLNGGRLSRDICMATICSRCWHRQHRQHQAACTASTAKCRRCIPKGKRVAFN